LSRILVVDDEPANRLFLSTLLASRGHASIEAATGDAALDLARRHRPDLIVLDLQLRGMSGPEFVRALRSDPDVRETRVARYTVTSRSAMLDDFMAASGIEYLIPKPGEPEDVLRAIQAALSSA
jgi:CheY-like chemotaxis protein